MPYAKSVALCIFSELDYQVTPLLPIRRYIHLSRAEPFLLNVKQVFQRSLAAFNFSNDDGVDQHVHGVGHGGVGHRVDHRGGHHVDHHDRRDVNHAHEAIRLREADFRKMKIDSEIKTNKRNLAPNILFEDSQALLLLQASADRRKECQYLLERSS